MRKKEYSTELANVVKECLDKDKWHYSFNEGSGVFEFGLRTKSKIQKINYLVDVDDDEIIVYGFCPIGADRADPEMMAQMAEFLCRANYGLRNGCFEFDFRDGEVRFRSFIDCEGVVPTIEVIKNSIYWTSAMFKHYAPGITDIIFAGSSAKKAIDKCEKSPEEELRSMVSEALGESLDGTSVDEMLSRLAAHLGVSDDDEDNTIEESCDSAETSTTEDAVA